MKSNQFQFTPIFFLDATVACWDNEERVYYRRADDKNWTGLWDDYKDFRNDLLCYLNINKGSRTASLGDVDDYLDVQCEIINIETSGSAESCDLV